MNDLKKRLKELGAPQYGDRALLWSRLLKAEAQRRRDIEIAKAIEEQRLRGAQDAGMWVPRQMAAPDEPSEFERAQHELTHYSLMPWCLHCLAGKAKATPHLRISQEARSYRPPLVGFDFIFMKSDCSLQDIAAGAWATTLVGVDEQSRRTPAITVDSKASSNTHMHNKGRCSPFTHHHRFFLSEELLHFHG